FNDVPNGNDRPIVRSGSSATSDLDTLPVPQNSHEAVERRDYEGAVREGESRTYPRLLLCKQATLLRSRKRGGDQCDIPRRPARQKQNSRGPIPSLEAEGPSKQAHIGRVHPSK